jgi:hypothetical protein
MLDSSMLIFRLPPSTSLSLSLLRRDRQPKSLVEVLPPLLLLRLSLRLHPLPLFPIPSPALTLALALDLAPNPARALLEAAALPLLLVMRAATTMTKT